MVKSVFLLSGEHPELSADELQHVLEILGQVGEFQLMDRRIAMANLPACKHHEVIKRTAYTKMAGIFLGMGETSELVNGFCSFMEGWEGFLAGAGESFRVDVYKVGGATVNSLAVEKKIAEQVVSSLPKLRISLENPEIVLAVFTAPRVYAVAQLTAAKPKLYFEARRAGRKPFKVPSALQPRLARCMVNLAASKLTSRVLDPFAGTGAIVVEAGLLGYEAVGLELKTWIANGMRRNIQPFCPQLSHVVQGDAVRPPFYRRFDAVATDPPYGRSASLAGYKLKDLLKKFFEAAVNILIPKARVVITVPHHEFDNLLDAAQGFSLLRHHDIYVHKNLTRRLVVLEFD